MSVHHRHRSSLSPSRSSVSPVSSGSDHSSPSTAHTHLPPPSSQPPPLPPSHARPHPPATAPTKPRIGHHSKTNRSLPPSRASHHHTSGGHVTSSVGHVTSSPRSRKPYETHHVHYPKHTVGPVPPSQHSSLGGGLYQWVRPREVGKPPYPSLKQDNQSNPSKYLYEPVAPGNVSVVNSKIVPAKMYPTVTEAAHLPNDRGSPDNSSSEVLTLHTHTHRHTVTHTHTHACTQVSIDPGERGSPSGESSPSSTPNNTLNKHSNRHMIVDSYHGDPKLGTPYEDEGHKKTLHPPSRGTCMLFLTALLTIVIPAVVCQCSSQGVWQ